jgi:hypothetical protein
LQCTTTEVTNTTDLRQFVSRSLPNFISQDHQSRRLITFQNELVGTLDPRMGDLEKAIAVRKWCRAQQTGSWDLNDDSSEDPLALLHRQRQGIPGTCRRFAYVLEGALLAAGLNARFVGANSTLYDHDGAPGHAMVEVWISQLNKWVLMDSMYNTMLVVDDKPASLVEVYEATRRADLGGLRFERSGATTEPSPTLDARYISMFKHLFYSNTNAVFDGYKIALFGSRKIGFIHAAESDVDAYPETRKQVALWSSLILAFSAFASFVLALRNLSRSGDTAMSLAVSSTSSPAAQSA